MAIKQEILDQYKIVNWESLLRKDKGPSGNLLEAKDNLDRIKSLFGKVLSYSKSLEQMPNYERQFEAVLGQFLNNLKPIIDTYSDDTQKQNIILTIRQQEESYISQLIGVISYLQFADSENNTNKNDIDKKKRDIEERLLDIDKLTKKIQDSGDKIFRQGEGVQVKEFGNHFETFANDINGERARKNEWCMYVFLLLTIGAASYFVWDKAFVIPQEGSLWRSALNSILNQNVLIKFFIVSAGGYMVAHFSRNYSAEMNMFYINKNKQMSLDSHRRILDSISPTDKTNNDAETHNAILIQVAKTIYESPETGYLKNTNNPVPSSQIIETVRSGISR